MSEVKINTNVLAPVAALVIAVVLGLGLNGKVQALDAQVNDLTAQVEQLEGIQAQIEQLHSRVVSVTADVSQIARARDDILRVICRILERPPERCGVSS